MSTALCTPRGAEAFRPHSHGLAFSCTCPESWPVARDGGCPGEQAHEAIHCARLLRPHRLAGPPPPTCPPLPPPSWVAHSFGEKRVPPVRQAGLRACTGLQRWGLLQAPDVRVALVRVALLAAAEPRARTRAEHKVGLETGVAGHSG